MIKPLFISAVVFALVGCETTQVITTNPMSGQRPAAREAAVSTFGLQGVDFDYAAKEAIDQFMTSPWFRKEGNRRRLVMMGEVANDTTFRIDTRRMTDRLQIYMENSGVFAFTAAIGSEATKGVESYRELDKSKRFDQSTGSRDLNIKPDLEMVGVIRQQTNISPDRSKQELEYEFAFRVVDLGQGVVLFRTLVPITKTGSNKNFSW
jgi:hypothetical protein